MPVSDMIDDLVRALVAQERAEAAEAKAAHMLAEAVRVYASLYGGRRRTGYPYSCGCTSMSRRPQQQA